MADGHTINFAMNIHFGKDLSEVSDNHWCGSDPKIPTDVDGGFNDVLLPRVTLVNSEAYFFNL